MNSLVSNRKKPPTFSVSNYSEFMEILLICSSTTASLFILLFRIQILSVTCTNYSSFFNKFTQLWYSLNIWFHLNHSLVEYYSVLDQLNPRRAFNFKRLKFHLMSSKTRGWSCCIILDLQGKRLGLEGCILLPAHKPHEAIKSKWFPFSVGFPTELKL